MSDQLKNQLQNIMESEETLSEFIRNRSSRGERFRPHASHLCNKLIKALKGSGLGASKVLSQRGRNNEHAWFNCSGDFDEYRRIIEDVFDTQLDGTGNSIFSSILESKNEKKDIYIAFHVRPMKFVVTISDADTVDDSDTMGMDDEEDINEGVKSLEEHLNEISPEDFGADKAEEDHEAEEIGTVGGSGTMRRDQARKHIARKMRKMEEFAVDPDRNGAFLIELSNLLNWADAIYGDDPKYKSIEHTFMYLLKSHGHKVQGQK